MASNPQWCLTLGEWRRAFSRWIRTPEPEAILNAAIFFDLRPTYGRTVLAQRLWEWLHPAVADSPLFITLLAQNALAFRLRNQFRGTPCRRARAGSTRSASATSTGSSSRRRSGRRAGSRNGSRSTTSTRKATLPRPAPEARRAKLLGGVSDVLLRPLAPGRQGNPPTPHPPRGRRAIRGGPPGRRYESR